MKRDGDKPVHEPGPQPNVEQEESTIIANIETKLGTTQDHQKTMPRRSSACQNKKKRLSIDESRKLKRFAQMLSSRNLENPCADVKSLYQVQQQPQTSSN